MLTLREKAQVQGRHDPISLPSPLCQDEAFRTFPPDDRSEESKSEKRQG